MRRIFWISALILALFFTGCEDEKKQILLDLNEAPPSDVPIAAPDANVTIDENLPPEPVVEGK
ncbi:hypothetical protein [Campylobacter sp. RM16190]|uniref:hypothetical protein n=1 Tax=Campylobacter sp. RM16190 TaxID=1705727 RepID=UPI0014731330|nr:hypothetical protein [Campylobacter sp. RM16190]